MGDPPNHPIVIDSNQLQTFVGVPNFENPHIPILHFLRVPGVLGAGATVAAVVGEALLAVAHEARAAHRAAGAGARLGGGGPGVGAPL